MLTLCNFYCFVLLLFVILLNTGSYFNVEAKNDMGKFRMEKINFIWDKALAQLIKDKDRLKRLQVK